MGTIVKDIPKTLTPAKAKNLLKKVRAEYLLGFDDFKHDMNLEAETIEEHGVEQSEWQDTINFYVKEIRTYTRDHIKLVKTIKAAEKRHADSKAKTKRSK